jgi:hypothetical protein
MKRAIAAILTATAVALPTVALTASPASASEPYVTKAEFRQVTRGMKITRVHRIFDVKGRQTIYSPAYPSIGIAAEQTREYRTKSSWGFVDIDYKRKDGTWVVVRKSAYWG